VVPPDLSMGENELRSEIERFAVQKYPGLRCAITLDDSFAAIPPEE